MKRKAILITPRSNGVIEVTHTDVRTDVSPDKGEPRYGDIAEILRCTSVMNVEHAGRILNYSYTNDVGFFSHDVYVVREESLYDPVGSTVYWTGGMYGQMLYGEILITGRFVNYESSYMVDARIDVEFESMVRPQLDIISLSR